MGLQRVRHNWETFTPCGNFPSRIVIFLDPSPRLLVQVPLSVFFSFPKTQIQTEIQSVQGEFTKLRQILDSEEAKELRKLKDELGVILKVLAESENDLDQEKLLVNNLISDVERHLQGSTMELLQVRLERNPASEAWEKYVPVILLMPSWRLLWLCNIPSLLCFRGCKDTWIIQCRKNKGKLYFYCHQAHCKHFTV